MLKTAPTSTFLSTYESWIGIRQSLHFFIFPVNRPLPMERIVEVSTFVSIYGSATPSIFGSLTRLCILNACSLIFEITSCCRSTRPKSLRRSCRNGRILEFLFHVILVSLDAMSFQFHKTFHMGYQPQYPFGAIISTIFENPSKSVTA